MPLARLPLAPKVKCWSPKAVRTVSTSCDKGVWPATIAYESTIVSVSVSSLQQATHCPSFTVSTMHRIGNIDIKKWGRIVRIEKVTNQFRTSDSLLDVIEWTKSVFEWVSFLGYELQMDTDRESFRRNLCLKWSFLKIFRKRNVQNGEKSVCWGFKISSLISVWADIVAISVDAIYVTFTGGINQISIWNAKLTGPLCDSAKIYARRLCSNMEFGTGCTRRFYRSFIEMKMVRWTNERWRDFSTAEWHFINRDED